MKPKDIPKKSFVIKEPLFIKSLKLAKSNSNKTGLMILFDLMFMASLFGLQTLFNYAAQNISLPQTSSIFFVFIAFSLIYYLVVLFVYSFFKYSVLDFISSLYDISQFSYKRLGQFYSLNIILAGLFFSMMIFANFILLTVKPDYRPWVFIAMAVPAGLFFYVFINAAHFIFCQYNSVKKSIVSGLNVTFTKIRAYRETIMLMIVFALILYMLFYGAGYLLRVLTSKNNVLYLNSYAYFKQAAILTFDIVFYFVILINRISFYKIVRELD